MRAPSRFTTTGLPNCGPTTTCDPAPACPACGGLRCLCRPRFFAGQLLTEEDLNRLDAYIVAKNQLHNRYLVGWGVACGLEVVCATCDTNSKGSVVVRPGYALSPCGNDIVVCGEQVVDVCALINACRPNNDLCLSPEEDSADCRGGNEEWILGICYAEKSARGVTALLNSSEPTQTGGCSCGGSKGGCSCGNGGKKSGCSCGNGGKKSGCSCNASSKPRTGSATPPCEPTLTCEGYSFTVWKAPKPDKLRQRVLGEAAKRFVCCIEPLLLALGQLPQDDDANSEPNLRQWYFDLRDTVRDFVLSEGLYDCTVAAQFAATGLADNANASQIKRAAVDVILIAALILQKCLCSALLPPCPENSPSDCVPIATLTVKRRPCQVLKICNLSARKFLTTIPNLEYWLSFLSILPAKGALGTSDSLRTVIERMCCATLPRGRLVGGLSFDPQAAPSAPETSQPGWVAAAPTDAPAGAARNGEATKPKASDTQGAFGQLLLDALATPERDVTAATLLFGAMGGTSPNGAPLVSDLELQNPADFLLARQIAAPALRAAAPFDLTALARLFERSAGGDARVTELANQVAELQRTVEALRNR